MEKISLANDHNSGEEKDMFEFCPNCGNMVDSATGICPICGGSNQPAPQSEVGATTLLKPRSAQPTVETPAYENPAPVQPAVETPAYENPAPAPKQTPPTEPESPSIPVYTPVSQPQSYAQLDTPVSSTQTHFVKKKSGGSVAATVLLSVSLFIFLLLAAALGSVRMFTSEKVMAKTMGNAKFSELIGFVDDNNFIVFKSGDGEEQSFSDVFYGNLQKGIASYTGREVTQKQLKKVIDKSTFMEFLGGKIGNYISDILNDTKDFELEEDQVAEMLEDNFDLFEKEFDFSLSNRETKELCDHLAQIIVEEDMVEAISPENIKDNNANLVNSVQIIFSWLVLILLIAISVFLSVIMFRNDLSQAALGAGIVCTVIGGIFTLGGIMALLVPAIWEVTAGSAFVGALIGGYFTGNLPIFGSILALGIAGLITRVILQKRRA